jgi:hypothetical protein
MNGLIMICRNWSMVREECQSFTTDGACVLIERIVER